MIQFLCKVLLVSALSISTLADEAPNLSKQEEIICLAQNIHFEARGESKIGQIAVAFVTLNRVKNPAFPSSICQVIKQPYQFSWFDSKKDYSRTKIQARILKLAEDILHDKYIDPTNGSLFFHNRDVAPFERKRSKVIGNHIFYQ